jgi:subtilisin family serine protease
MRLPAGRNATGTCTEMLASGDCEGVQPNFLAETPESNQGTVAFYEGDHVFGDVFDQDAMNRIGVDVAHEYASGSGIVVAILDTGIDYTHPDLAGSVSPIGWDFVDDDDDPMDAQVGANEDADGLVDEAAGHGTHVAGLVHAVAPSATLMAIRVLNSEGFGTSVDVACGVWFALEHGADVINMSFGMEGKSEVMRRAIKDAEEEEIFLVASAGNGGRLVEFHYPAKFNDVMGVAATDARDRRASFSNTGSFVGISAPGERILSTYLHHGYAIWSGTSMSTPLVAGAAALWRDRHGSTDVDDAMEEIEESAVPIRESDMGAGRLAVGRLMRN